MEFFEKKNSRELPDVLKDLSLEYLDAYTWYLDMDHETITLDELLRNLNTFACDNETDILKEALNKVTLNWGYLSISWKDGLITRDEFPFDPKYVKMSEEFVSLKNENYYCLMKSLSPEFRKSRIIPHWLIVQSIKNNDTNYLVEITRDNKNVLRRDEIIPAIVNNNHVIIDMFLDISQRYEKELSYAYVLNRNAYEYIRGKLKEKCKENPYYHECYLLNQGTEIFRMVFDNSISMLLDNEDLAEYAIPYADEYNIDRIKKHYNARLNKLAEERLNNEKTGKVTI